MGFIQFPRAPQRQAVALSALVPKAVFTFGPDDSLDALMIVASQFERGTSLTCDTRQVGVIHIAEATYANHPATTLVYPRYVKMVEMTPDEVVEMLRQDAEMPVPAGRKPSKSKSKFVDPATLDDDDV